MSYEQYGAHNYMGEHATDADALVFIRAAKFDTNGDGTGNPRDGMWYFNTTSKQYRYYTNGRWVSGMFTSSGVTPPSNPVGGELWWNTDDNHLYYWDSSRSKWLATSAYRLEWGDDNSDGALLRGGGIVNPRSTTGRLFSAAATVTEVAASVAGGEQAKEFELYKVGGAVVHSFTTSGGVYSSNTINADVDAADKVWMRSSATGGQANDISIIYTMRRRYVAP